jgi:hypothetical protein
MTGSFAPYCNFKMLFNLHTDSRIFLGERLMALSSKDLQKKRAKKAAKRKETRKAPSHVRAGGVAAEWSAAVHGPIADVFVPEGLFETGMGSVWFSRELADGRYALAMFLVDSFCLGVKNALYAIMEPDKYRVQMENFLHMSGEQFVPRSPEYARKLVETATAYASELGFDPHPDYRMAKLIFGEVEASACEERFVFGRGDQPVYMPGPGDTPAIQRRVLQQLEKLSKDPIALLARGYND